MGSTTDGYSRRKNQKLKDRRMDIDQIKGQEVKGEKIGQGTSGTAAKDLKCIMERE